MALHEQCVGATDEWYTPPYVFDALGVRFDVDVASPGKKVTPWVPALGAITHDSLILQWCGFVWMNPPFGGRNGLIPWLDKFARHGHGICLVPDRTSAPWWQTYARMMDLALFVSPKIRFIDKDGNPGNSPAQGTTLFALGDQAKRALRRAEKRNLGFCMKPDNR